MKKLLYIFTILLISCSSDSSTDDTTNDAIIGKWYFGNTVYKLDSGGDYTETISSCESQTYYKFYANGTAEIISYYESSTGCTQEENNISEFTWSKITSNTYQLHTVEIDGSQNTNSETVYFEDTQTMYWVDVFNGTIEGNDFNERWSYFNKQ